MRRAVVLLAALTFALAALSADAATPAFRYGVAAGEITATSAVIWTRTSKAGPVEIHASSNGWTFVQYGVSPRAARAVPTHDLTFQFRLPHLEPDTSFRYWFVQGKAKSPVGTFRTAPRATADQAVRFAISGDADATAGPDGKPGFNRFEVYGRMAAERNDFNVNLGDTIYSDSELAGAAVARTASEKWQKYRLGLALPAYAGVIDKAQKEAAAAQGTQPAPGAQTATVVAGEQYGKPLGGIFFWGKDYRDLWTAPIRVVVSSAAMREHAPRPSAAHIAPSRAHITPSQRWRSLPTYRMSSSAMRMAGGSMTANRAPSTHETGCHSRDVGGTGES